MKLTIEERTARVRAINERSDRQRKARRDLAARLQASPLISAEEAGMITAAICCGYAALDRHFAKNGTDRGSAFRYLDECGAMFLRDARVANFDVGY